MSETAAAQPSGLLEQPGVRIVNVARGGIVDEAALYDALKTGQIAWRAKVEGYRSDHMALSPDASRLLVSASTARKANKA